MMIYFILYNEKAGSGLSQDHREKLEARLGQGEKQWYNVLEVNLPILLKRVRPEDRIVLCGGDGTLNHFINDRGDLPLICPVLLEASGSGNDFMNDIGKKPGDGPVDITEYLEDLPLVEINGKVSRFINGIGYGIDGYCCEMGDRLKAKAQKAVNYTPIAIKGLLYGFHRTRAEVEIDGRKTSYRYVWLAPTMKGRFYGGGMMAAPMQDRKDGLVTLMVMHCPLKLYALAVFPSIFKGKHIKHTRLVHAEKGRDIRVRFDRPTSLQIDGETVLGVREYHVFLSEGAHQ